MHADFLRGAHAPRVQCSAPSRNTRELARRNAFDLSPVRLTSDFRFQLSTCSQPPMDTDRHGFNPPPGLQTFDFCPAPFGFRLRPLAFSLRIVCPGKPVHGTEAIPTTTGRARRLRTGRRSLSERPSRLRCSRRLGGGMFSTRPGACHCHALVPSTLNHQPSTFHQPSTSNRFSNHNNRRNRRRAGNQLDGLRLREGEERDGWFGDVAGGVAGEDFDDVVAEVGDQFLMATGSRVVVARLPCVEA